MRRLLFGVLAFGLLLGAAGAQERITLTSPETVSNTDYKLSAVYLDYDGGAVRILLKGVQSTKPVSCVYDSGTTPSGSTILTAMNKRNFATAFASNATTGSLVQAMFYRLFSGGLNEGATVCGQALVGTLTGSVP